MIPIPNCDPGCAVPVIGLVGAIGTWIGGALIGGSIGVAKEKCCPSSASDPTYEEIDEIPEPSNPTPICPSRCSTSKCMKIMGKAGSAGVGGAVTAYAGVVATGTIAGGVLGAAVGLGAGIYSAKKVQDELKAAGPVQMEERPVSNTGFRQA